MTRTGVFLCTCDGEIANSIDPDAVPSQVQVNGTWTALVPHICLPDGIRNMESSIFRNQLDRVVVAACAARFQEHRLRRLCVSAGLNPNHLTLVDWREGCASPHRSDTGSATLKAIDLVKMGIARVENAQPLQPLQLSITPAVVVIGGGCAGTAAAQALAARGIPVTLIEQGNQWGGQPNPRIDTRLDSQVVAFKGTPGNYHIGIRKPTDGETSEIGVGAVIVATGTRPYRPTRLYGYDGHRVLTLEEFASTYHPPLPLGGEGRGEGLSLVYILCAGSRSEIPEAERRGDDHIPYCSQTCCLAALNQALQVKHAHPDARITILFRDLYLLGDEQKEEVVRQARRAGIAFARYSPDHPPLLKDDQVIVADTLSNRRLMIPYDRVVLATPQVPREDAGVLAHLLNLPRDENGFFIDPHRRSRPELNIERGIFICGSAHRPVDADTAILQGLTAAARAARYVTGGILQNRGGSATVQPELCTGCAQCVETCAFGAIRMTPPAATLASDRRDGNMDHARIDPFLCQACGNCVAACPSRAIGLPSLSDAQIFAQIDAVFSSAAESARSIVFACTWSGFAAMELAGARRMPYPTGARVIELPCSARLDPLHVLYAFFSGAERVVVALCPPDECHYGNGNRSAEARIASLREQIAAHGIDPHRLVLARMMGDDAHAWVKAVTGD